MATYSAGIVLYRIAANHNATDHMPHAPQGHDQTQPGGVEILLVHPGGPFWAKKDLHGWSIPKGEYHPETENALAAAEREFEEELGSPAPEGKRIELGAVKASSKIIHSWLIQGDFDPDDLVSNTFDIEWPPKSGRQQTFPEVDKCCWFDLETAKTKLHKGHLPLLKEIVAALPR